MLPDVAGELLSFFRNFRPGLFPFRRGDQESNTHTNSESESKTKQHSEGAVVIILPRMVSATLPCGLRRLDNCLAQRHGDRQPGRRLALEHSFWHDRIDPR